MSTARQTQFDHLDAAKKQLLEWAGENGVSLARVEFVVPFVETDFGAAVWLFYQDDAQVMAFDQDGTTSRAQAQFLSFLEQAGYPAEWLPDVAFYIDSQENIDRNYQGSYFYRLR
jgi:hypothetical protein